MSGERGGCYDTQRVRGDVEEIGDLQHLAVVCRHFRKRGRYLHALPPQTSREGHCFQPCCVGGVRLGLRGIEV